MSSVQPRFLSRGGYGRNGLEKDMAARARQRCSRAVPTKSRPRHQAMDHAFVLCRSPNPCGETASKRSGRAAEAGSATSPSHRTKNPALEDIATPVPGFRALSGQSKVQEGRSNYRSLSTRNDGFSRRRAPAMADGTTAEIRRRRKLLTWQRPDSRARRRAERARSKRNRLSGRLYINRMETT